MLDLSHYGVPDNLPKLLQDFFTSEMKQLADQIEVGVKETGHKETIQSFKDQPLFKEALGWLAVDQREQALIEIAYNVEKDDLTLIHFEWRIPNQLISLTFSNLYFVVYFNELYTLNPYTNQLVLSKRGAILRALTNLSYTPWNDFLLPISNQMTKDFMTLPLFDSGKLT